MGIYKFAEFKISLRYLLPHKKQVFTSVISLISLLGIMIGVWALIVVTSVLNGFRAELLERILGVNGHIVIQSSDINYIKDFQKEILYLQNLKDVKLAMGLTENQVLIQVNNKTNIGALVRGITEDSLKNIPNIANNIKSGNLTNFKANNIAIGKAMANKLNLHVGDKLNILSPQGDVTPFGTSPRIKSYTICAIYEVGMYEYDSAIIFMPLQEAQNFFNYGDTVQSIEIYLKNADDAIKLKPDLVNKYGYDYDIISWNERNQAFFTALNVERNTMFLILSLIVLVATLNIISGLIMLVKDKTFDIAILRTMGAPTNFILRIFIIAGMCIGGIGTSLGLILGLITCFNLNNIQYFISKLFGVDVFNPQLYFLSKLPYKIDTTEIFVIVLVTLILSFLATLIPAWQASKLDPINALRYE